MQWKLKKKFFDDGIKIDLFIIQIKMKNCGGHKLADRIRSTKKYRNAPILFIASYSHDNIGGAGMATYRSFRNHNYISTPICRLDVQGKLGLYIDELLSQEKFHADSQKVVYLEYDKGAAFIKLSDIFFAEIQAKVASLYTSQGTFKIKRTSHDNIIDSVDDENFIRTHKSFAANVEVVSAVEREGRRNHKIIFNDGTSCPLSPTYYEDFIMRYSAINSQNLNFKLPK